MKEQIYKREINAFLEFESDEVRIELFHNPKSGCLIQNVIATPIHDDTVEPAKNN